MTNNKSIVFVALDYDSQQKNFSVAHNLAREVDSNSYGFKINLDSVANFSPDAQTPYSFIRSITDLGKPIFVDMKMWNGGRTMENIAKGCADLGVDIVNMYPHAGGKFVEKVRGALEGTNTKLFGLTVLTHYTDDDTKRLYGKNVRDTVRMLAEMNNEFGVDGIVVPGTQLEVVRDFPYLKLCPGVRPSWFEDKKVNAQEQIVTPEEAISQGANYLVIGSPILKSGNPSAALERILTELN